MPTCCRAADTLVRLLWAVADGEPLREAMRREAGDWISGNKAESWRDQPDDTVIGARFSPACYIAEAMPAALYLAWKYHDDFAAGIIANAWSAATTATAERWWGVCWERELMDPDFSLRRIAFASPLPASMTDSRSYLITQLWVLPFLVAGAIAQNGPKPAPLEAEVYVVKSEPFAQTLSTVGTLRANESVTLVSELSRRLVKIHVAGRLRGRSR